MRQLRSRLFGLCCSFAFVTLLFGRFVAFAFAAFVVAASVVGGADYFAGFDGFFPGFDGLAFGGLDVNDLLDGDIRNGDFGLFALGLLLAFVLLAALLSFTALLGLSFASVLFAALAHGFLGAAIPLEEDADLVGLGHLGADHFLAFDHEGFGADGFGVDGLGIFNNYTGDLFGAGHDGGNFLLAATAGGDNHRGANCADIKSFFHNL